MHQEPSMTADHMPAPPHLPTLSRRELLRAGITLGAAGLTPAAFAGAGTSPTGAARSVILLWMDGGPSHLDTFDPKSDAPGEIRGGHSAIPTSADGVQIGSLLPRMARQMHRVMVLRGLSHAEGAHERACRLALTGDATPGDHVPPSVGEVIRRGGPGACASLSGDAFGFGFGCVDADEPLGSLSGVLEREPVRVRDRYGRHDFGARCLAARHLVERGAQYVSVSMAGWDTHCDNDRALQERLLPPLDQGMSALLEDLNQRGLLARTLVVWMGEFGRSPRMNALAGRDHWPRAACALLAGGGVPGGQVIGATDRYGEEPDGSGISPRSIAAAILRHMGMDAAAIARAGASALASVAPLSLRA
jgi:uncharacterized protein (DUF1501 family)